MHPPLPPPTPLAPPLSIFSSASYSRPQPSGLFLFVAAVPCPDFCFLGGDREEPPVLSGLLGGGEDKTSGPDGDDGKGGFFICCVRHTHKKKADVFCVGFSQGLGSVMPLAGLQTNP